jgi:hypothetical protein
MLLLLAAFSLLQRLIIKELLLQRVTSSVWGVLPRMMTGS